MARHARHLYTGLGTVLAALILGMSACRSAEERGASSEAATDARQAKPAVFYVRPEGAGTKDGSSWLNAMGGLPAGLKRGSVYWVASGQYGGYTFDDPLRGDSVIRIRKATEVEHGDDEGWKAEYGRGRAGFGPLRFETGRYTLEGGGPDGIKVVGQMGHETVIEVAGPHIVLRQVEVDGGFRKAEGKQIAGACNGINIHGDHAFLDDCNIHDVADDGIGIYASHVTLQHSTIHDLDGCGTDGDCGPCYNGHSDGIELSGAADVELVGNLVYDVRSNAALFMDDWSGSAVRGLLVFNNVFYTPDSGFAVYLQKLTSAKVHNNVIWGKTQGSRFGGLAIGREVRDLEMYNNIILNINYTHMGASYDETNHRLDYNLFGMINAEEYEAAKRDLVANPQFAGIPMSDRDDDHSRRELSLDDFVPRAKEAIDTGTSLGGVPSYDIRGEKRPLGGASDRGPFESLRP